MRLHDPDGVGAPGARAMNGSATEGPDHCAMRDARDPPGLDSLATLLPLGPRQ
jgi:hypothetical protein